MDDVLAEALAPVLRDLAHAGLDAPVFGRDWTDDPDYPSAMMWRADGSGAGVSVPRSADLEGRVVQAADHVQEWVIEGQLWGAGATNWPVCPTHPDNHPLQARVVDRSGMWVCPADESAVRTIGG